MEVQGFLALDVAADLVILKVAGRSPTYLMLAALGHEPAVGSRAYAIGNPEGLANTLSEGLVSGRRQGRKVADMVWLQTTAPISHGSSGGPLLDASGRVIGVTTKSLAAPDAQNLNFAVPSDKVRSLLDRAARASPIPLNRMPKQP
jgi:S1-C subfamily serine protease